MGNYGNTMDRWYRRGAVVLWPTRLDFEVRAEASPALGARHAPDPDPGRRTSPRPGAGRVPDLVLDGACARPTR